MPIPVFSSTKSAFLCAFALRNPHFRAFRAQNRVFCALLAFGTPVFGHFEHKIEVFVLFLGSGPLFSGVSSTKSWFLCAFCLQDPRFRAFRARNRVFCAFLGSGTLIFGRFEHKIGIFVLGKRDKWHREGERGRSCKTKRTGGRQRAPGGRQPAPRGQTSSTPRGRQPAPRGADNQYHGGRQRGARGRHMLPRAPGALRLQLLLVGYVLWVEVGPAGKPVV